MDDELKLLKEELKQINSRARELRTIIAEKEKLVKGEETKFSLDADKRKFWNSRPQDRTDAFTDWELVYWSSYLLANTPRREILSSVGEVAKRAKRIRKIVDYYMENFPIDGDKDHANNLARNLTKDYLQYVLWYVPSWKSAKGVVPMTFYPATSDWAVNNYGSKAFTFSKEKQLTSLLKPFDEDD